MDSWNETCQACGASSTPLFRLSLGKDFFGRPYDRLSPQPSHNPQWYCTSCSVQKNLHRDFRDIHAELNTLLAGQSSELSKGDEFRRATLRLQEILIILSAPNQQQSPFLRDSEVRLLMERLNTLTMPV